MPYSKKQKVSACIAYNAKIGKVSKSKLKGTSLQMFNTMSEKQLKDFCKSSVKRQG